MRGFVFLAVLVAACGTLSAQLGGESSGKLQDAPPTDLPTEKLTFSEPNLNSPLDLPSSVMNGPPICGPEGRSFIEFMTSPPMYNIPIIASVDSKGKVGRYSLDRVLGLANSLIISYDPGVTMVVLLLRATPSGAPRHGSSGFYLALFSYEGEFRSFSKLDLGFEPTGIAQLLDNSFLVIGADRGEAKAKFAMVDSSGTLQRTLDTDAILPSNQEMDSMLAGMNFAGTNPAGLPPSMRIAATLSLLRPIHSRDGLLTLEPGAGARIFELRSSGESKVIRISLPVDQVADSLVTDKRRWFVRAFPKGSDSQMNLFEIDPETGKAVSRIDTSGVPATSIACPDDAGFYGIRWIQKKPYLITGEMR